MAANTKKYVLLTDSEVQTFPEGEENQYTKRKIERRRKKWQDVSKPVARHFNLPNRSEQPMEVCGLSLHLGSSESCKKLEQNLPSKSAL